MKLQLGLSLLLISASAFSAESFETSWVTTEFWKAPHAKEITLLLRGKGDLARECDLFKRAIFKSDGSFTSIATNPARLSEFKLLTEPVNLPIKRKLGVPIEYKITIISNKESEFLPHFEQRESRTGILLDEYSELTFSANPKTFSYTEFANKYSTGQTIIDLKYDRRNGSYSIYLSGRDVACDLYEGNGTLKLKAPSYVIIGEKGFNELEDFYDQKLMPEITDVLNKGGSNLAMASRIGFRVGKILNDKDGKWVEQVMKQLFLPNSVVPKSNVLYTDRKFQVSIPDRTEAPETDVTLTLIDEDI